MEYSGEGILSVWVNASPEEMLFLSVTSCLILTRGHRLQLQSLRAFLNVMFACFGGVVAAS